MSVSEAIDQPDFTPAWSNSMLVAGMRACADETGIGNDRASLRRVANKIEQGGSVDEILQSGKTLPHYLNEVVREGLKTDRFPQILEEYLKTGRQQRLLWREFYRSLLYPAIIVLLAAMILSVFLTLVGSPFKRIFEDFGVEMPGITLLVLDINDSIQFLGWFYWLGLLLLLPILFLLHWLLPGRGWRVKVFERVPLIGTARRDAGAAEFCSRLSVLIDAEIPLHRSLDIMSRTLRDRHLRTVAGKLSHRVEGGLPPEDIARGPHGLLPVVAGAFRWSRDPRMFADGLRSLSNSLAAQARVRADQFGFFVEPVTVIVVGCMVGIIILAGFMPLFKLLNDLS